MSEMLYDEGFEWLEPQRWSLLDEIPWDQIEKDKLTPKDLECIMVNTLAEFTALDATIMFLRDFKTDIDFSCFMSIWFYEEMKHYYVLKKYLKQYGVEIPDNRLKMLHQELPPGGMINTLTMHLLGEIKLHNWYIAAHKFYDEPVIKMIYKLIAADELRHGQMYFKFLERKIAEDRAVAGQMLRMARFLIREEGDGSSPKHPVPQLVEGDDSFDFGQAMNDVFAYVGMGEAAAKSEAMGYRWLGRLTGHTITDMDSLGKAIKAEKRAHGSRASDEALPALGVFG